MAFKNDKLSYGYHPDFCSTCSANDCHGACVCPVKRPAPGRICDACSGTGCPKCGCDPAPQQTFLCHTRMSFPKCTCDGCPKKCMKCCRRRIPCDSLPADMCGYSEDKDDVVEDSYSKEDSMAVDEESENTDEEMELDRSSAGAGNFNNLNNVDHLDCCLVCPVECAVEFMDTTPPPLTKKPSTRQTNKDKPQRRSVTKSQRPRRRKSSPPKRKSSRPRRKSTRLRRKSSPPRSKSSRPRSKSSRRRSRTSKRKARTSRPSVSNPRPVRQKPKKARSVTFGGPENENEPDLSESEAEQDEDQEQPEDQEEFEELEPAPPTDEIMSRDEDCVDDMTKNVTRREGPCVPPAPVEIEEDVPVTQSCGTVCETPCFENNRDPCNPRPDCSCNRECQKEYCMMVNCRCLRCDPLAEFRDDTCSPCEEPEYAPYVRSHDQLDRHPCDEEDLCEEPCDGLFGDCLPEPPCPKPCNTGECENPCVIM